MTVVEPRQERRPKLAERLVAELRAQLASGDLRPGQRLPTESKLTQTFGVSRTVVREAMAALAADGLVEARQGAGVFVVEQPAHAFGALGSEIGRKISHALDILEVRMGMEIESAGLAALRRNSVQEAAIYEAYHDFDRLLLAGEATGRADFAFHRAIAAATNNPFYVEILDALGSRAIPCDVTSPWGTDSFLTPQYQAGLQEEHLAILRAVSVGDADAARGAMRRHLAASQQRYRERLSTQEPRPVPDTAHEPPRNGSAP
jgi:DNA-binding FadR family transcriptional regulator